MFGSGCIWICVLPLVLTCCILCPVQKPCVCMVNKLLSKFLHKVFSGKEMIVWSVESLVRMLLRFLTSEWLFASLRESHPGFRSLVFSLSWQSHQAAPFKHYYSLRATFLDVLGVSNLRLDMWLMPLDTLLKCWDFNSTFYKLPILLPSFLKRRAVNFALHFLEQPYFCWFPLMILSCKGLYIYIYSYWMIFQ